MQFLKTESFELSCYTQGDPEAKELALVIPGLLDTKDYPHVRSHVDYLSNLGYLAIACDMPGIWKSGGDSTEYSMTNSLRAINETVDHFDKPTIFIGHSAGGWLAALSAIRDERAAGLAAIMCAPTFVRESNYEDRTVVWKLQGRKRFVRDNPANPVEDVELELPYSFCEDAQLYDARQGLENLTIPKLFIAGEHDTIVYTNEVAKLYERASQPKRMETVDSDHDYRRDPEAIEEVNKVLGDFLFTSQLLNKSRGKEVQLN